MFEFRPELVDDDDDEADDTQYASEEEEDREEVVMMSHVGLFLCNHLGHRRKQLKISSLSFFFCFSLLHFTSCCSIIVCVTGL